MATKKGKTIQTPSYKPTESQQKVAASKAKQYMKKHGLKTVDEYIKHIDSKRGY